jgi:hypothetical protein
MPKRKNPLSFTEARREIENAPPYEYSVYQGESGETHKVQCAGKESFCLIQTNAKALALLRPNEKQMWRVHETRVAVERVYKSFPPELRYIHEHPILVCLSPDGRKSRLLSPETEFLRVAVYQLMNHQLLVERIFELLACVFPKLLPSHFKFTDDLKGAAEDLRNRYDESEKMLENVQKVERKNLIMALNRIDALQQELEKTEKQYAKIIEENDPPPDNHENFSEPASEVLNFAEIEAWSAKEADLIQKDRLAGFVVDK